MNRQGGPATPGSARKRGRPSATAVQPTQKTGKRSSTGRPSAVAMPPKKVAKRLSAGRPSAGRPSAVARKSLYLGAPKIRID
jgi:hypothetical protein